MQTRMGLMIAGILMIAGCMGCDSNNNNNNDFAGLVDIGSGRNMYIECRGTGSPTVVFISGLLDRTESWTTSRVPSEEPVYPAIARTTRVCAYDRPGTILATGEGEDDFEKSRSDAIPQPITLEESVADLRALLTAFGEPGPYVVVAHSWGGAMAKYYTSNFPEEVSGLVLVDYLPYKLRNGLTDDEWEDWKKVQSPTEEGLATYPEQEWLENQTNLEQELASPPFEQLPLIVLSSTEPFGLAAADVLNLPPEEARAFLDKIFQAVLDARAEFVGEVPGSTYITDTDSGHYIHQEHPNLISDAVREVVEAVRKGCTTLTGCE